MAAQGLTSNIASEAYTVTPSDTADNTFSYLYVGGAGNVVVTPEGPVGTPDVTYTGVLAGMYLWIRTSKVKAATTATLIIGHR